MPEYLHPRDIDEFADEIKTNYLECRVHGHSRTSSSVGMIADVETYGLHREQGARYALKTLRCRNRCGVTWAQIINFDTGEIVSDHGPDYSRAPLYLAKGLGRLVKNDRNRLRLEQLHRWLEAHADEEAS